LYCRCAVESTVTFYPINNTLIAFRFQSFRFLADHPSVYLHCRAYTCPSTDYSPACQQNCHTNAYVRLRRAARTAVHFQLLLDSGPISVEYRLNNGPISVVMSSDGQSRGTHACRCLLVVCKSPVYRPVSTEAV